MRDDVFPQQVRELLEERFWRPIERAGTIEDVVRTGDPLDDPAHHPFLFADHGVVHVRDIAEGVVELAAVADGLLLPRRDEQRQAFVVACGVALTYLHDIGMVDPTPEGRRIHPAFAAHTAFSTGIDDVVDLLLADGWCVVERLRAVEAEAGFVVPVPVVLREVLSLSIAHSKSTVPAPRLDDPKALREQMRAVVLTPLADLRDGVPPAARRGTATAAALRYEDADRQPYAWMTSPAPAHRALVDDVVDAVRIVRSADALRQRGTTLRTAGGYEVFMEAATGEAVYALRTADGSRLLWVRVPGSIAGGEANLRAAWVTPKGDLRISFQRGAYLSGAAFGRAVEATAEAVDDIQADVLPSFAASRRRLGLPEPGRDPATMLVQLERPQDDPVFADAVTAALLVRRPSLAGRLRVVADVESAHPDERARYHRAEAVAAGSEDARTLLARLRSTGMRTEGIDVQRSFEDVRRIRVEAGETLVVAGSAPSFVYVPEGRGLVVRPRGGYGRQEAGAWVALGGTGAVRGAERNSDVVVECDVDVVMIPAQLFVREWFRPYDGSDLAALIHGPR